MVASLCHDHQRVGATPAAAQQGQHFGLGIIGIELDGLATGPARGVLFAGQQYA